MTKIDLIKLIGDLLVRIDVVCGSLLPNNPQRNGLDQLRAMLDERQLALAPSPVQREYRRFSKCS